MSVLDEKFEDKSGEAAAPQSGAPSDQSTGEAGTPAATPASEPAAAPPAAERRAPDGYVPIDVLLRTRDEGNAAKARLRELEAREAERERKRTEAAEKAANTAPDKFAEPELYDEWMLAQQQQGIASFQEQLEAQRIADRLEDSEEKWTEKLGDDKWRELNEWIAALPENARDHFTRQRDPYGAANKAFAEQQRRERAASVMEKLGDKDLDAYLEEQRAAWIAEHGQPAAHSAPHAASAERPRAPDGKFAPSSQPAPRRSAPSLANVSAAPAAATPSHSGGSALDQRYS